MPQLMAEGLDDFAGSPVAFYPLGINSQTGVATLATAGATYDSRQRWSLSSTPPTGKGTKFKNLVRLTKPHMDAVDTTKKIDESIIEVRVSMSRNATLTDRRNLRVMMANALLSADLVTNLIDAQEGIW